MSSSCALIYSQSYQKYSFSPQHPLKPERLLLTAELIRAYGLFKQGVCLVEPRLASDDELKLIHDHGYIEAVKRLSDPAAGVTAATQWGLGPGDNPIFAGMHEAAATMVGGALVGAEKVMKGELDHVFHIGGGLHHALKAKASGFCIYNDPAIAIAYLKRHYQVRVLYIDIDAHHGDGVQYAFEDDPDVLTISFHESGMFLFPGTGFTQDIGRNGGRGYAVNLPLAPYSADDIYLEAFDEIVVPLARTYKPDIILTQNGCDAHWSDPLSHLSLTLAGYKALFKRQHQLVHELTGGRWLSLGGGGYQAYTTVPRAWTIMMAVMADKDLDDRLPEEWRRLCARFEAGAVPEFLVKDEPPLTSGSEYDKARAAARKAVKEIKETVFPLLGSK